MANGEWVNGEGLTPEVLARVDTYRKRFAGVLSDVSAESSEEVLGMFLAALDKAIPDGAGGYAATDCIPDILQIAGMANGVWMDDVFRSQERTNRRQAK